MHDFVTAINGTGTTLIIMLLAYLGGIWINQRGVDKLEAQMNARFNTVDAKFNAVEAKFNTVEARFNSLDARIDRIHQDFASFHHTLGQHDARLDNLEN
jgi:hypothetical protein